MALSDRLCRSQEQAEFFLLRFRKPRQQLASNRPLLIGHRFWPGTA